MASARVVVLSRREVEVKVWQASQYEFEDVITEIDDAALVTPRARRLGPVSGMVHGATNRAGRRLGRPRRAAAHPVTDAVDAELCFAMFAAPHEIGLLPHAGAQLARSERKVAFIVELWRSDVEAAEDYLRQLRGFDHVFLFSRAAIPDVERITGVPCSYLPTAVDTEVFAPRPTWPERTIDVTSYGRRLPVTHEALLAALRQERLHYHFDTVRGPFSVTSHVEHRLALASALQRSRYAVVYKNNDEPERVPRTGGEESLTNRYFECAAAGAVMLGSAPDVEDFTTCFDWPDALVPIGAPAPEVIDVVENLDGRPERMAAARRAGVVASLRRHDWAHRWRTILDTVGMVPHRRMEERLRRLDERADAWELSRPRRRG